MPDLTISSEPIASGTLEHAYDPNTGKHLQLVAFLNKDGTINSGASSGGGGAVTIADGADTNAGTTTDVATAAGAVGTLSAKLRYVTQELATIAAILAAATPAGGNIIGKVGIDHTTPRVTDAVTRPDLAPTTGNITVVDSATATTTGLGGQSLVTGAPTPNSFLTATVSGESSFSITLSATWTGTVSFEKSSDGGTTYVPFSAVPFGSTILSGSATSNGVLHGNCAATTHIRIRATAAMTGTLVASIQLGYGLGSPGLTTVASAGMAVTGTGAAPNATPIAATDVGNLRFVSLQILNVANSATVVWEQSNDNATWIGLVLVRNEAIAAFPAVSTIASVNQMWTGAVTGRYFRVRISAYTSGTVSCSAWFSAVPPTPFSQQANIYAGTTALSALANASDNAGATAGLSVLSQTLLLNGSSNADRARNNHEVQVFASAARTTASNSADIVNYNGKAIKIVIDVTAVSGAASLIFTLKGKSTLSGKYFTILASASLIATGTVVLTVFPGAPVTANSMANDFVPRLFRVEVGVLTADSATYSVDAQIVG